MHITISGHHVDVTEAIHNHVESKLERLTHHSDLITGIDVTVSVDKLIQKADAKIHVNGKDIFAVAEAKDLYTAIDAMTDKLDRQLIKHKEKRRSHR